MGWLEQGARRVLLSLIVLVLAVGLAACSTGRSESSTIQPAPGAVTDEVAGVSSGGLAGSAERAMPEGESGAPPGNIAEIGEWDQRIIRTADLTLSVTDVEHAIGSVRQTVGTMGGRVLSSTTRYRGEQQFATMQLDVPSDRFDDMLNALRTAPVVAKVEEESTGSTDVTEEFIDLQARLRNAQATEERFLALQQEATTLQDTLTIEREIARVRAEIEQLQGRLNYLERRTSFSRIIVSLQPESAAAGAALGPLSLGRAASEAWEASLKFLGRALSVVVQVVVFLWWFWLLVAIGGGLYLWMRNRRRTPVTPEAGQP